MFPILMGKINNLENKSDLPKVTTLDNGKVLTVVNGVWGKGNIPTPPSQLPIVTSDDNGDVLTVVEGEWAKAAPSGGGDSSIFTVMFYEGDSGLETDTTFSEIEAAFESKYLCGKWNNGPFSHSVTVVGYNPIESFTFEFMNIYDSVLYNSVITFASDGTISLVETGYTLTPATP